MFTLINSLRSVRRSRVGGRSKADLYLSVLVGPPGSPARRFVDASKNSVTRLFEFFAWLRFRRPGLKKYSLFLIPPSLVSTGYLKAPPHHFGVVRSRFWDWPTVPPLQAAGGIPQRCVERVNAAKSWAETDEIDFYYRQKRVKEEQAQEFSQRAEKRYAALDSLIDELRVSGRLRTRKEFEPRSFREKGGIGIVVNEGGSVSVCDGHHRFGIALALNLTEIPVALYAVHPSFAKSQGWLDFCAQYSSARGLGA